MKVQTTATVARIRRGPRRWLSNRSSGKVMDVRPRTRHGFRDYSFSSPTATCRLFLFGGRSSRRGLQPAIDLKCVTLALAARARARCERKPAALDADADPPAEVGRRRNSHEAYGSTRTKRPGSVCFTNEVEIFIARRRLYRCHGARRGPPFLFSPDIFLADLAITIPEETLPSCRVDLFF